MWINMGPQHPMTHGLWNLKVKVDGDIVVDADPEIGYLHRGVEKITEYRDYLKPIPLMDRLCYVSSVTWAHAYCLAVEELMDIEPPPRGQYLRVIACELQRMASHLMWLAAWVADLGILTGFLYSLRERELTLDLLQLLTGARMNQNYPRPGGVHNDMPPEFERECLRVFDYLDGAFRGYMKFLEGNEVFRLRSQGMGVLPREVAINYGVTGPNLRGSGAPYDVRREDPYDAYAEILDEIGWESPVRKEGDPYARYRVRMQELFDSMAIVRHALRKIPQGQFRRKERKRPEGEAFRRTEDSRGEALFYVIGDGTERPYRCKIRSPIFVTMSAIPIMVRGHKFADIVSIVGSIDVCVGEIDK
jgi:NADH-quinone oxidoreductase subunit D